MGKRVLIVDNSVDLAESLGELIGLDDSLEYVGYVTTGADALEQARRRAADVLVLDLGLSDMSGMEVLAQLQQEALPARVILHTGHASDALAEEATRRGARGYVVKGSDVSVLLAALREA
ncbi:MAG: response regulator transcription factor [Gammaproteobacteria bacterium]|nr:response regulator transcription factor [Gammaproteobacteria bacterium]